MDFLLKQRLVGAVVLVALGVIFIPMFLEGPSAPVMPEMQAMPEQQVIPREDTTKAFAETEKVLPLPPMSVITSPPPEPVSPPEKPLPEPESKPAPEPVKAKVPEQKAEKEKPEQKPQEQPEEKPVPPPKVADKKRPEASPATGNRLGGWVIQAGSFSNQKNAFALRDKLRKADYPTQVERVVLDQGVTYRVRIGPYLDRDKAEAKIDRLNKKFQLKSRVLSYP